MRKPICLFRGPPLPQPTATTASAVDIHTEEFETDGNVANGGTRYLATEFVDGSDYLTRHDFGATNPHPSFFEAIENEHRASVDQAEREELDDESEPELRAARIISSTCDPGPAT